MNYIRMHVLLILPNLLRRDVAIESLALARDSRAPSGSSEQARPGQLVKDTLLLKKIVQLPHEPSRNGINRAGDVVTHRVRLGRPPIALGKGEDMLDEHPPRRCRSTLEGLQAADVRYQP
jgi:hypothetical protein